MQQYYYVRNFLSIIHLELIEFSVPCHAHCLRIFAESESDPEEIEVINFDVAGLDLPYLCITLPLPVKNT